MCERNWVYVINEGIDCLWDFIFFFLNEKKFLKIDIICLVVLYILYLIEFLEMVNIEYEEMIGRESLDEDLLVILFEFDLFGVEFEGKIIVL